MCLIIYKPAGVPLVKELLQQSVIDNPHGWGMAIIDQNGMTKVSGLDYTGFMQYAGDIKLGDTALIHTRWATHGVKALSNCHPFQVSDDIMMAHNGVMSDVEIVDKDRSDTFHFVEYIARPMFARRPDLFNNADAKYLLGEAVGNGNKLVFLRADREVMIVNEKVGQWYKGLWLSNGKSLYGQAWGDFSQYTHDMGGYQHTGHQGFFWQNDWYTWDAEYKDYYTASGRSYFRSMERRQYNQRGTKTAASSGQQGTSQTASERTEPRLEPKVVTVKNNTCLGCKWYNQPGFSMKNGVAIGCETCNSGNHLKLPIPSRINFYEPAYEQPRPNMYAGAMR